MGLDHENLSLQTSQSFKKPVSFHGEVLAAFSVFVKPVLPELLLWPPDQEQEQGAAVPACAGPEPRLQARRVLVCLDPSPPSGGLLCLHMTQVGSPPPRRDNQGHPGHLSASSPFTEF